MFRRNLSSGLVGAVLYFFDLEFARGPEGAVSQAEKKPKQNEPGVKGIMLEDFEHGHDDI